MSKKARTSYHHGNLRTALLGAALELVQEQGVGAISLREVARRAGVSHAAPAHHFKDKAGLLTALACEGFERFASALRAGAERAGGKADQRLSWVGYAYVMFAAEHRAYFEVMFRPELLRDDDGALAKASLDAYEVLLDAIRLAYGDKLKTEADFELQAIRAWSEVHGLATLWLHGNLSQYAGRDELDELVRRMLVLC